MSRRRRAVKRKIAPDPKYSNLLLSKLVNMIMVHGKKSLARSIVYDAIEGFGKKVEGDPIVNFELAIENAKPFLEVKSRRVGGATYQVPIEINADRRTSLAMRWIITHARNRVGRNMTDSLVLELVDCYNKQGTTIKKKDDTHRMAEANKAFAHFKW